MSTTLSAQPRQTRGKGGARAVRRSGAIPAILYGGEHSAIPISLDGRQVAQSLASGRFFSTIHEITLKKKDERVLPRSVQFHPVTNAVLHVDLQRVSVDSRVNVEVPVSFSGHSESPGLKFGGILNIVRHSVELICRAADIPKTIAVDLSGRKIGETIHISHVELPEGARPVIADRDFTIATISAPKGMTIDDAESETSSEEDEEKPQSE